MKILLSGAEGFTGLHFADQASQAGHDVVPLLADLTDRDGLQQQVNQCLPDAVVHLAGISFVGHGDDRAFYAVNVLGTTNLLAALSELPKRPKQVLLASSANIYGNCVGSPITESQVPAPVNHYAMSKLAMEHMARTFADKLPLVITRPFNYTGPGQSPSFVIPKLVDHFARRAPSVSLGNLNVEREFNDVNMVCSAYLQLLDHGEPGHAYNVCSGQPYSLQYVLDKLTLITGHKMEIVVNPIFVRANEVNRLCGSPIKLHARLAACGGKLHNWPLEVILRRMLGAVSGAVA